LRVQAKRLSKEPNPIGIPTSSHKPVDTPESQREKMQEPTPTSEPHALLHSTTAPHPQTNTSHHARRSPTPPLKDLHVPQEVSHSTKTVEQLLQRYRWVPLNRQPQRGDTLAFKVCKSEGILHLHPWLLLYRCWNYLQTAFPVFLRTK
jgi:hypothetical protein